MYTMYTILFTRSYIFPENLLSARKNIKANSDLILINKNYFESTR